MPKYTNQARAEFMAELDELFNIIDPSGANAKYYHDKWDSVSDAEFDKWIMWLGEDDFANNFYWEIDEYDRPMKMELIFKAMKKYDIPIFEKCCIPHINNSGEDVIVTPDPVPVGYIHIKRLPQTVHDKNTGSTSISKRSALTNQVTGQDKNARITNVETYALKAYGANHSLKELMGFRADDEAAKTQAYNAIAENGVVRLADLESGPEDKVAVNTLDTYYTAAGMKTNLVSGTKLIKGPKIKL